MHELGVLLHAMRTVDKIAKQNNILQVKHVTLQVGEASSYLPMFLEKHTSTVVMPLEVDISPDADKVTVPMDIIKESLKHVSFIGGMDECLYRQANDYKDYPQDLGCLFLGEAGKIITKHGLGRQLTYEEACARVDEAAEWITRNVKQWIEG